MKSRVAAGSLAILDRMVHSVLFSIRQVIGRFIPAAHPYSTMVILADEAPESETPILAPSASQAAVAPLVRESERVRLRRHVPANRDAFQRWYADPEIAYLLRHDLRPLNDRQSRGYFDSIILPLSAAGHCFAIHDAPTDTLIGTTALTECADGSSNAMLFRIVIGEKAYWDQGFGTEATKLVVDEAFDVLGLDEVRLEVFAHNPRAIKVYERVGFVRTGERTEWVGPNRPRLHVFEMSMTRPRGGEHIKPGNAVLAEPEVQAPDIAVVPDPI